MRDGSTLSVELPQFVADVLDRFPLLSHWLRWWVTLCYENPIHILVETTLVVLILYILFKRPGKAAGSAKAEALPAALTQELIDEYEPEPLCPPISASAEQVLKDQVVLLDKPGKYTTVEGVDKQLLNLATMDFLGLGQREEIAAAARAALDKYGCGSCGPRGFYGSIDVHVYLEQDLAKFFGTEEAIVYSDASSTASSAIPAFSNRADLLIVDDGCNDSIMTGVNLSRSRVLFFKHNDLADLRRKLQQVEEEDARLKRAPQRRFIVIEGLYRNFGDICALDEVFKLKKQYRWRVFLDESHAVGVLGANGRGAHEHFGIPINEVDLVVASLSTVFASVGGFCVGSREVIEHQRLAGAGYCFSASSPPFVSTAASAAIKVLDQEGKTKLMPALKRNATRFHADLTKAGSGLLEVASAPSSALVHVRLDAKHRKAASREEYSAGGRFEEESLLRAIARSLRSQGFLLTTASYVSNPSAAGSIGGSGRPALPPPSLRLALTASLEEAELTALCKALVATAKEVLGNAKAVEGGNAEEGLRQRK